MLNDAKTRISLMFSIYVMVVLVPCF